MEYPSLTAEEKEWQAQDDARCLAEAEVIKGDPERMKAASSAAEKMRQEAMEKAVAMDKIAKSTEG